MYSDLSSLFALCYCANLTPHLIATTEMRLQIMSAMWDLNESRVHLKPCLCDVEEEVRTLVHTHLKPRLKCDVYSNH